MRPGHLNSQIFLDSGDPKETNEIKNMLGFLDGQTTNPSLIAKNPATKNRLERGEKFTEDELLDKYREIIMEISKQIPNGSVSVEVYADAASTTEQLLKQGQEMFGWIPNAHIKYPIIPAGLEAAEKSIQQNMRVNMTLCFQQEQAAAVYAASQGAEAGAVFVSPFVGRLDDRGQNGMDLIKNILAMYQNSDGYVQVLTASVRNLDHLLYALKLQSSIITAPFAVLKEWGEKKMPMPEENFSYPSTGKTSIAYQDINLDKNWREYNIQHQLTDVGLKKFADDWNNLLKK